MLSDVFDWYRVANYLYKHNVPLLPIFLTYCIRIIFGCYIPSSAQIGSGTKFGYGGIGVVIHARSIIGKNCIISQGVTLGGTSKKYGVPCLGDNVLVGCGAKIMGPVFIGDNVVIGANSVVIDNIPSNTLAVGIPARVIKQDIIIENYI